MDPQGEHGAPIRDQAPGKVDPQYAQLAFAQADAQAATTVEIELRAGEAVRRVGDPGGV